MAADGEGPGNGASEDAPARDEIAEHRKNSRVIIPEDVRAMFQRNLHSSDRWRELNAMYFFHKRQAELKREEEANTREEEKLRLLEEQRKQNERLYPSQHFILAENAPDGDAKVTGSVFLPMSSADSVPVQGYVLHIEPDGTHALIVVYTMLEPPVQYFTTLCDVEYLPKAVVAPLKKRSKNKRDWTCVEFDTYRVKRGSEELHLVTKGPLSKRTCDHAMAESLLSGFVLAVRCNDTNRPKYGTCCLPFARGRELQSSEAFTVSLESSGMCLNYASRTASDVPRRILACARAARNNLLVEEPRNGSLVSALNLMESFAHHARETETELYRCLNIALGGPATFGEYGRFVPCRELSRRFPFPNGSFSATPCSCDIERTEDDPEAVSEALRKMKPVKQNNKGHNYVSRN